MERALRVLIIEDSGADTILLVRELRRCGYQVEFERVETTEGMQAALGQRTWDLILSDYNMPQFNAPRALELLKASGLDLPFIIISGTIGEEAAVAALKAGAHDFLVKGKFARLGPAIERELREAKIRLEHRQAEQALRASERRFRALIENGRDNISLLAVDGSLLWESPATIRGLGYSPHEFVGRNIFELIHPDDLQWAGDLYAELLQKPGSRQDGVLRLRHSDGSWRWNEVTVTNMLNEPSVHAIVVNYRDVTRRRQAEEALQASEHRFRRYFELGLIGMAITAPGKGFLEVNDRICEILGYERAELVQITWDKITHPDDLDADIEHFNRLLSGDINGYSMEKRFIHRDGGIVHTSISVNSIRRADGSVDYLVALMEDISERKKAEEALRRAKDFAESVIQTANVIFLQLDTAGNVLKLNTAAREISGYDLAEIEGQNWFETLVPRDRYPYVWEEFVRIVERGEAPRVFENPILTKQGEERHVIWKNNVMREGDRIVGTISFGVDITERKQTEMQLANALAFTEHILTSSPIGILTYSLTGECLSANVYAAQMVGATVEQLRSQNFHMLQSWKDSGLYELAQKAVATGELSAADVHILSSFGKEAWFRAQLVTFKSGGEHILLLTLGDISEAKRSEIALRESEESYRQLFEAESDAIFLIENETGQILQANNAACILYGYSREELLAKKNTDLSGEPEQTQQVTTKTPVILDQVVTIPLRFHRKKDGTVFPVEITGRFFVHQDRPVHIAAIRDITERTRAEEALREKEGLLSEAQRIGRTGSWRYDIVNDALQFSDEMYRLFDVTENEFSHNREGWLSLIYAPDRPAADKWLDDLRVRGQPTEVEFLIFRKTGELRYIRCRGAVEFDRRGQPVRFLGTAQDVTERKLAEIQIRQQIERLTALRAIDQAISSSFDLSVTLEVLVSQVISQLQVDAADVLLLEPEGQTFTCAAAKGFYTNAISAAQLRMADSQAARERRLIQVQSLKFKPDARLVTPLGTSEDFDCYFGAPLMVKGKVKGVLEVFHRTPLQPYPEWLDFLHALAGQAAIAIENAQLFESLERSNRELSQAYDATIEGWSRALDLRDKETEGHTQRVTEMMLRLARVFGLPEEELLHIRRGALLHDIGKMGVPDHILLKQGELTEEEWARMRTHPEYAYNLLQPIAFLTPALDIPYCHHEKWDGTGYPRGLKGEEIPLVARLFAVVDTWDALLSDRPYRPAWSKDRAEAYIRSQAGSHFDPKAVEGFLKIVQ